MCLLSLLLLLLLLLKALSGLIERRTAGLMGFGGRYEEVYAEVRAPGSLHLFKEKKSGVRGDTVVGKSS
jgi:hypothetical protein